METHRKHAKPTHQEKRGKAATTTAAALDIITRERDASETKVSRLRALRLAREALLLPEA